MLKKNHSEFLNKKRTIIQNVQRTFETQQRENEQHDFKKMSQRSENILHQRRYTDGR